MMGLGKKDGIAELVRKAAQQARRETPQIEKPERVTKLDWPLQCTVGPGLEGAIACESGVGYVNGTAGRLLYRGYDIYDLSAASNFEEVCYLLLYGKLPTRKQFDGFCRRMVEYRYVPNTLRMLMATPVEEINPMAALRLGTNFMRRRLTWRDTETGRPLAATAIASDEDSIPMETIPRGEEHAIYEFAKKADRRRAAKKAQDDAASIASCIHVISGIATLAAAIARLRDGKLPIEPDPELGHSANFLYMMTGRRPTAEEVRIMDVALILHADHGMPASTFSALVVASTLSDIYFSVGAAIAALNGPLHGGANEAVIDLLESIGSPEAVPAWFAKARKNKQKIVGFGHRVYKTYDPRARILGPLAKHLGGGNPAVETLYETALALEQEVVSTLGEEKGIYPNVDFYSGLVYRSMGIPKEMFTPIFAVSRAAGWTARIIEYLKNNRIFRPRALYTGEYDNKYVSLGRRK